MTIRHVDKTSFLCHPQRKYFRLPNSGRGRRFRGAHIPMFGCLVAVTILAIVGTLSIAYAQTEGTKAQASREASATKCPADMICLAIPNFRTYTNLNEEREQIISSAIPDILQIALLRYEGIQLVPNAHLWRALRQTHPDPGDWRVANLSQTEVLRKAGANFLLSGQLYERQGSLEFVVRIKALTGKDPWRSNTIRSERFSALRLFEGIASLAPLIVQELASDKKIRFQSRNFVAVGFCDRSASKSGRSEYYSLDIPSDLARRPNSNISVSVKFISDEESRERDSCVTKENAEEFAKRHNAAGVIFGSVDNDDESNKVSLEASVFLSLDGNGIWHKLPLATDGNATYLEQKYRLYNLFDLFLGFALEPNGYGRTELLRMTIQSPERLDVIDKFLEGREFGAAEFLLIESLVEMPKSAPLHVRYARLLSETGRLDLAIGHAKQAVVMTPDLPEVYKLLGDLYLAQKDLDNAEATYTELARLDSSAADAHLALGSIALVRADRKQAIEQFHEALRIDPENGSARSQLAELYSEMAYDDLDEDKYKDAYEKLDLALKYDPAPRALSYFDRAYALSMATSDGTAELADGYERAIADYNKALEMFNGKDDLDFIDLGALYLNRTELLIATGKYDDAIRSAQDFLKFDSQEFTRYPEDELLARFLIVMASILGEKPRENAFQELKVLIESDDEVTSYWSFDLLDRFIAGRNPPVPADDRATLEETKAMLLEKFGRD